MDRTITCQDGTTRAMRGKVLRPFPDPHNHQKVKLCMDGRNVRVYVHVAVLEAFVGQRPPGAEGRHRNDDPLDNRLANLQWGTHAENMADMMRNGNHFLAAKTRCGRGHAFKGANLITHTHKGVQRRICRSCRSASSFLNYRFGPSFDRSLLQPLSDEYYAKLRDQTATA
jgi:hypothetical protein